MNIPTTSAEEIAWLSAAQMVEVDRIMMEDLHIELIQMMENAGRNLAQLSIDRYNPVRVTVCAGSGGNGGGGLVAARHLHVAGLDVSVVLSSTRDRYGPVPLHQLDIIDRLRIPITDSAPSHSDLVIDAVIGYSLRGAPRGLAAEVIEQIASTDAPILSLDAPSGLDTTTGELMDPHVVADATLTLAAPKLGLRSQSAVGELFVANISVPPSVFDEIGAGPPPDFSHWPIIRVEK